MTNETALENENRIFTTLPVLDLDHPGAKDPDYQKRRKVIVSKAIRFHQRKAKTIPLVNYTSEEHNVWKVICDKIRPLHEKWACSIYKEGRKKLPISEYKIPQLRDLSVQLQKLTKFRLEPIHGLVDGKIFLMKLAENVMLSTQYIRHHSKPEFTPEPDIIHEVLGHVPMFTNPQLIEIQQMIGTAAKIANEKQLDQLGSLYWFTIEYGLIEEEGEIKAFGAGLLGGIQDLTNAFSSKTLIKRFDLKEVLAQDYNYSFEQQVLFVIPSLDELKKQTLNLIESFNKNT